MLRIVSGGWSCHDLNFVCLCRAPTPTGKPGKMGERFPVGILNMPEKSRNFTQDTTKFLISIFIMI